MARMSLSQAAQSVAGKQPVQPVPLVGNPYGLSPALAPQVAAGESFLRNNMSAVPARRMSPPLPTPGSNAYRVAPAGTLYNPAGQRDGRAIGVPYGPGAYPVINTHNPTMVVLPPRFDRFSRMQDNYNQFFNLYAPMFRQMMQQAMQQGAKAARPVGRGSGNGNGNGSAAKPANDTPVIPTENVFHSQIPAGGLPDVGSYADAARRRGYIRPDLWREPTASDDYEWYRDNHRISPDVSTSNGAIAQPAQPAQPIQPTPAPVSEQSQEQSRKLPVAPYQTSIFGGLEYEGSFPVNKYNEYRMRYPKLWYNMLQDYLLHQGAPTTRKPSTAQ